MHTFLRAIKTYHKPLLWFSIITIIFGTMYVVVQQQNRLMANDMPMLLATENARLITNGVDAATVGNASPEDISTSLIPFVVVYDKAGKPVGGAGYLDRKLAQMPLGALQHATTSKPNYVTWQPKQSVRLASVVVATKDYYVVGAQSLKATEDRAGHLLRLTALGYGLAVLVAGGYCMVRKKVS